MEIKFYRVLANKFADAVINNGNYCASDSYKIRHSLICIFSDLYKFMLYLILFLFLSMTKEFFTAFLAILVLRPVLGGFHAKSEISCIIISFLSILFTIVIGRMNPFPLHLQLFLMLLLPIIGAIIAPVQKKVESKVLLLKLLTAFITLALLSASYYLTTNQILFMSVSLVYLFAVYQYTRNMIPS